MLTSADETDLLIPLHDATLGDGRFSAFLQRLRQRTRATHAGLLVRAGESGEMHYPAGLDLAAEARARGFSQATVSERLPLTRMRPARVYASGEFIEVPGPERDSYLTHLGAMGVVDERVVRIAPGEGLDGWLVLSRGEPSPASDSALLSALVPHLTVALRCHAEAANERLAARLADEGLDRAATGTLAFDGDARLLSHTGKAAEWLRRATGRDQRKGERLRGVAPDTERRLAAAAARYAAHPDAPDEALVIAAEPRIDAVLTSGARFTEPGRPAPAMVALCRFPPAPSLARAGRLSELHALPRREAELAIRISDGASIAEAAEEMGLTLETARNYTKRIYARLGVRGQAELARLVCTGGAALG